MTLISLELPASAISCQLEKPLGGESEIILRPLALTDAPKIAAAIQESLAELKQFMPWSHYPQTVDSQRTRIIGVIHDYWRGKDYGLGIFGAHSNAFMGGTGLHQRTLNTRGFEIGYWIRSSLAGQGLATLVTRALIVYGFEYLGLTRIQCAHNANNLRSARVNDKCGFKIEGKFKNYETVPTEEMIRNGWRGSHETVVRGLCPEDVPPLGWYQEVKGRLTVFDWLGQASSSE